MKLSFSSLAIHLKLFYVLLVILGITHITTSFVDFVILVGICSIFPLEKKSCGLVEHITALLCDAKRNPFALQIVLPLQNLWLVFFFFVFLLDSCFFLKNKIIIFDLILMLYQIFTFFSFFLDDEKENIKKTFFF